MPYATAEEVDLAVELGYEVECDTHRGHRFTRGNRQVWGIESGWQTADIINDYYRHHWPYKTLTEALNRPQMEESYVVSQTTRV